jgi:hypothetical protein
MDACPDGFFIGVVEIFAFPRSKSGIFGLKLNKNNYFQRAQNNFVMKYQDEEGDIGRENQTRVSLLSI